MGINFQFFLMLRLSAPQANNFFQFLFKRKVDVDNEYGYAIFNFSLCCVLSLSGVAKGGLQPAAPPWNIELGLLASQKFDIEVSA